MRALAGILLASACVSGDVTSPSPPPGIVALHPAYDLASDAEVVVAVHADGTRNSDAAQALAARVLRRSPDLIVVAAGTGHYAYGLARVEVRDGQVRIAHARTGEHAAVDARRLRELAGTMFVRLRPDTLLAEAFDARGVRLP